MVWVKIVDGFWYALGACFGLTVFCGLVCAVIFGLVVIVGGLQDKVYKWHSSDED